MLLFKAAVCALSNIGESFLLTTNHDADHQALHLRAYISLPVSRRRKPRSGNSRSRRHYLRHCLSNPRRQNGFTVDEDRTAMVKRIRETGLVVVALRLQT